MPSEELTTAIRRQVEVLTRPAQRGSATVVGRTPSGAIQSAEGGVFHRRYDWSSAEELSAALYGRSHYTRARYRSGAA